MGGCVGAWQVQLVQGEDGTDRVCQGSLIGTGLQ